MQVGDLVEWHDYKGAIELGIVIEIPKSMSGDRALVHFIVENENYYITTGDLEVICE
tara:strand:- start:546 stop:716 length:171 start_codon:yes stop_codon:yes gene_type:complete